MSKKTIFSSLNFKHKDENYFWATKFRRNNSNRKTFKYLKPFYKLNYSVNRRSKALGGSHKSNLCFRNPNYTNQSKYWPNPIKAMLNLLFLSNNLPFRNNFKAVLPFKFKLLLFPMKYLTLKTKTKNCRHNWNRPSYTSIHKSRSNQSTKIKLTPLNSSFINWVSSKTKLWTKDVLSFKCNLWRKTYN